MNKKIILASNSPRRKEILSELGIEFDVIPANIEEVIPESLNPKKVPEYLAELKASHIAREHQNSYVIGSDTIVLVDDLILGKPKDINEAISFFKMISDRWHSVISGVSIINNSLGYSKTFSVETKVKFKKLSLDMIREYISKTHPYDKAGGYAIQEYAGLIIDTYTGSLSNVIGFPKEKFIEVFKEL